MKIYLLSIALALTLIGCTTATIMPQTDGTNLAVYESADKDGAQAILVHSADKYCKDKGQTAVYITTSQTEYKGKMDEETKNTIRKVSKVGTVLGGVGTIPDSTRTGGAVLGTAGTVGLIMTSDKDYKSQIKFKCQ